VASRPKKSKKPVKRKAARKKVATKAVKICFRVWRGEDGYIRLFSVERPARIKSTVAPKPGGKRSHPHLYKQLDRYLRDEGR